jgi:single-strand DNA-binding protein
MNTVTLIGTLTKDPELREGNGDGKVCAMRIAERSGRKGAALFINVSAFGRQAETCERYLSKGRHVAVAGRLRHREWEADGGERRSEHSIVADRVDFLPGGGRARGEGGEGEGGGRHEEPVGAPEGAF